MGKRNKFSKIGLGKNNYKALLKANKKLNPNNNITVLNNTRMEEAEEDFEEDLDSNESMKNNKSAILNKTQLNKSIINEDLVMRQSNLLGIDKDALMKACENPTRNRRAVTKIVLSKGQRRRQEKRQRFKRKEELVEKIKLNNSMINVTNLNKTLKTENLNKTAQAKKEEFNLFELDNTLANIMNEEKNILEEKVKMEKSNNQRSRRNLNKLLNAEKEKIKKVIDNKNYQSNPLEAMKYHIKNAQLIQERNKKIEENFQKNYNFLNLKKIGK